MKPIVRAFLALFVLVALPVAITTSKHTVRPVYAQNGCSVATLKGAYAFSQTGSEAKNAMGSLSPFANVGVSQFDGVGNFSATFTDMSPGRPGGYGAPLRGATGSGTYTVNADCTGSISISSAGITLDIVIVGGGTEVFGINTTLSSSPPLTSRSIKATRTPSQRSLPSVGLRN